jgi:hypothetical protein
MEKSVNYPPENLWVALEERSQKHYEEKFLSPINTSVEKLKEVFINRHFYADDNEWLSDVAGLVFDLCEETNNEEHWMYPKEEFQESYVTS